MMIKMEIQITIANLFNVQKLAIVKHINNIYSDEELDKKTT